MGDLLVFLRDGIAAWLPLFFAVLLVLMVYILWRTLQVMPRVTAAKTITSDSRVSWNDVAEVLRVAAKMNRDIDNFVFRHAHRRWEIRTVPFECRQLFAQLGQFRFRRFGIERFQFLRNSRIGGEYTCPR